MVEEGEGKSGDPFEPWERREVRKLIDRTSILCLIADARKGREWAWDFVQKFAAAAGLILGALLTWKELMGK